MAKWETVVFSGLSVEWAMDEGRKFDFDKLRYSLLPWEAVQSTVEVLEYGAKKYAVDNWKHLPNPETRFFDAAMRHLLAWHSGEEMDSESGLPHLAHCSCCILFLLWFQLTKVRSR